MKLQDIYDQLAHGELRNLFIAKRSNTDVGIAAADFAMLLPSVQAGLTDLHTQMFLREDRELVTLEDGKVSYLVAPTGKEVLAIENVKGTYLTEEYDIPLDDSTDAASIRRTGHNMFTVPDDEEKAPWLAETGDMTVIYRANHPQISDYLANAAPLITEIYLPSTHLWALVLFVASRVHNGVGIKQEFHAGNNYFQKYMMEVEKLKTLGLDIETANSTTHFYRSGMP